MKKLNIVFIHSGNFPIGGAYANRMHAFAKGLTEDGHKVNFLVIYPGHKTFSDNKMDGTYQGVNYKYLCGSTVIPKNSFAKALVLTKGVVNCVGTIFRLSRDEKVDAVISGTDVFLQVFPVFMLCKLKRILFLREYNEYPPWELKSNDKYATSRLIKGMIVFRLFGGFILISHALEKYFRDRLHIRKETVLVPIIVDPNRFRSDGHTIPPKDIVFVGDIGGTKDGVDILIRAYRKISNKIGDDRLVLIGDIPDETRFARLREASGLSEVKERVIFTGYIHRDKVGEYLNRARVLVLARPANKQAEAGFPTKLGEYLATGNPVVCTDVGDIPLYLKDGQNAFVARAGDIDSFAERLLYCYRYPEKARAVGLNGRELVDVDFNYRHQSKRVAEFIKSFSGDGRISPRK